MCILLRRMHFGVSMSPLYVVDAVPSLSLGKIAGGLRRFRSTHVSGQT